MLETVKEYSLAINLLRRRARVSIVHQETGIPKPLLRTAYQQLHGRSSPSGSMKYSTRGVARNARQYKETVLFAVCFQLVDSNSQDRGDVRTVMTAYDLYKRTRPSSQLDFSAAWVIARDLRTKQISLVKCVHCCASVLLNVRETKHERCVVCKKVVA